MNAFKTIAARINQIKVPDLEVTTDQMSKAEAALSEIGIQIRQGTSGSLQPLSTTLSELASKWSTLTDVQKSD